MMQTEPFVSIIVPAYFSYNTIKASLQALKNQSFKNFEIIVVNSSQESYTENIIANNFPEVFFFQSKQRLFPHAARNKGVTLAKGNIFVFTDPDCQAETDWLQKMVNAVEQGNSVVGGGMGMINRSWLEKAIHLQKFYWCLSGSSKKYLYDLATANACYTKETWEKIGPFNPDIFSGDSLLAWQARANNIKIKFVSDAVIKHDHKTTLLKFLKERFFRGQDFSVARTKFQNWSKERSFLYLIATPFTLILMLFKTAKYCFCSSWGINFLTTLPLQILGHSAWLCGEAVAHKKNILSLKYL